MGNEFPLYPAGPKPTEARPLQGVTVLVVEDSRLACEAIRLLGLRSGARIRRANSLAAAHRHLAVYRPSVVIADIGLPDGTGASLMEELARAEPRVLALIGMSGDPGAREAAMAAGADGFLAKPVESLALFQQVLLAALPLDVGLHRLRVVPAAQVAPDLVALEDDLTRAVEIMRSGGGRALDYGAQFLGAVARSADDGALAQAAERLARAGRGGAGEIAKVAGLIERRIAGLHAG